MKLSVVISAGGSLCCNYATDLCIYGNYASDNVCCIFAGFQVLLSVTGMLVDLSVKIMQVTVSVEVVQLEVSAAHMQVTVSATYVFDSCYCNCVQIESLLQLCRWHFLQCIMHMTISIAIMRVTFHYSYAGHSFK